MPSKGSSQQPFQMGGIELQPGTRVGAYIFLREVGSGGMARVLLAKNPAGELVALKVLRKSRIQQGMRRFRREFRALSRIHHPNVVRVEAYGDLFGHPFIAMEYVEGPDLHQVIRSMRTLTDARRWQRSEAVLVDLCRALSAVHRKGLVHRDLKPSNVLVASDGTCKLTDFGIVKDLDPANDPHGGSTTLVGTWAYASPEQCQGQPIDARSDLYSLGIILFAMLTGKRPFVAKDLQGYLELHRDRAAPAPRDVHEGVPEHLNEICLKLLEKDKNDRYQSATEILYRLEAEERPSMAAASDTWVPPLVGRMLEMEAIREILGALTAGQGGVLVLDGDDGAGKSRLLEATVDQAKRMGFRSHHTELRHGAASFDPTLSLLKAIVADLGERAPVAIRKDLEVLARGDTQRTDGPQRIHDTSLEILRLALEEAPHVLALDDIHEAHPRELATLRRVLHTLIIREGLPLLVVTTLRPRANSAADDLVNPEVSGMKPREVYVGPLSRQDVTALVNQLVNESEASKRLAERLHRETEGNPLFVSEFLRSLMNQGVLRAESSGYQLVLSPEEVATSHVEIPQSVRHILRARLQDINKAARHVLDVLAVAEHEVDIEVVLDVTGHDEEFFLTLTDQLLKSGLVRERRTGDDLFHTLTHRTFTDVLYRDLTAEVRSGLHLKMAQALEVRYAHDPMVLESIGEHYRRAGEAGRAYRYLIAAAKRLLDRSLIQEAWDLTERVGGIEEPAASDLPSSEFRSSRRDLIAIRSTAYDNRGEWNDALLGWRAILASAEDEGAHQAACDARLQLASVLRRMGDFEPSTAFAEQALEAARRLQYKQGVAEALHCMATLAWDAGDAQSCERLAQEGLRIAEGPLLAHHRARLLLALTVAQAQRGHLAVATSGLTEAEGIFRELRQKRSRCLALVNLSELLSWLGEPHEARQRGRVGLQLARELHYRLGIAAAQRALATSALDLGRYDEARTGLLEALKLAKVIGIRDESIAALALLARVELEEGQSDAAAEHARAALALTEKRDPEQYGPLIAARLAWALAQSDPDEAGRQWQIAHEQLESLPTPRRAQTAMELARAAAIFDRLGDAKRLGRWVAQMAGSHGYRLLSLEARALLCAVLEDDEQDSHLRIAKELMVDFLAPLNEENRQRFMERTVFGAIPLP